MDFNKILSEARSSQNKEVQQAAEKYLKYQGLHLEEFNKDKNGVALAASLDELQKVFLNRLNALQARKVVYDFEGVDEEPAATGTAMKRTSTMAGYEERPETPTTNTTKEPETLSGILEKGNLKINLSSELTGKTISAEGLLPHKQKWPVPTVERGQQFCTLESVLDVSSYYGIPIFCLGVMSLLLAWVNEFLPEGEKRFSVFEAVHQYIGVIEGRVVDLETAKARILSIIRKLYDEPKPTKKNGGHSHTNFRTSFLYQQAPENVKRAVGGKH